MSVSAGHDTAGQADVVVMGGGAAGFAAALAARESGASVVLFEKRLQAHGVEFSEVTINMPLTTSTGSSPACTLPATTWAVCTPRATA